jgi:hypothetical protein
MKQEIEAQNSLDNGNPTGGWARGTGIDIRWQDGPLGRGDERNRPNGAFIEGVLEAARQRLVFFQSSKFACRENAIALTKIEEALHWLDHRTRDRETRQVEGTHSV